MTLEKVKKRAQEYCEAHGLYFHFNPNSHFITIGQSGFSLHNLDIEMVDAILDRCREEHEEIETVKWKSGLMSEALCHVDKGPTRTAIEDELSRVLDEHTLDKVARVFYKYGMCKA